MTYPLLKLAHLLGLALISGGLLGVFLADMRSRQLRELSAFAEAVRAIAVFYDGVVVPGALLLFFSGLGLIHQVHGGWEALKEPWIAGMALLFALEFIEGNTITRLYFMRLRRLTATALARGAFTPELSRARGETLPSFTHFLDLPAVFLIVTLAVLRPGDWTLFWIGSGVALMLATVLTLVIPRLYPWEAS